MRGGGEWVTSGRYAFRSLYRAQAEYGVNINVVGKDGRFRLGGLVLNEVGAKGIRQRRAGRLWEVYGKEKVISYRCDNGKD